MPSFSASSSRPSRRHSYDRNGDGDSQENSTLSTDATLVQRLHALLEILRIPPPYLLIGHSMGGAYIRLFSALYHRELARLGLYRLHRFYADRRSLTDGWTNRSPHRNGGRTINYLYY